MTVTYISVGRVFPVFHALINHPPPYPTDTVYEQTVPMGGEGDSDDDHDDNNNDGDNNDVDDREVDGKLARGATRVTVDGESSHSDEVILGGSQADYDG